MASALKNLSTYDDSNIPSAEELTIGIVVSDYHNKITHALYEGCMETLLKHGAKEENIHIVQSPGAFELPAAAKMIAAQHNPDAVICQGCVIQGETKHNDYINQAVATALATLGMATGKAFIFGVLTPNDEQQALERAGGKHGNKGVESAIAAIRMGVLKKELSGPKKKIGF